MEMLDQMLIDIPIVDATVRCSVAVLLGMLIGVERSILKKPASIRTFSFISLGSCIFTLLSLCVVGPVSDPARIAAQIVSGVGFIGAGVIIKDTSNKEKLIEGITTAAMIWFVAALGMVCGFGYTKFAFVVFGLYLVVAVFGIMLHHMIDKVRTYIQEMLR